MLFQLTFMHRFPDCTRKAQCRVQPRLHVHSRQGSLQVGSGIFSYGRGKPKVIHRAFEGTIETNNIFFLLTRLMAVGVFSRCFKAEYSDDYVSMHSPISLFQDPSLFQYFNAGIWGLL